MIVYVVIQSLLAAESRSSILASLQPVVEMHEFLQVNRRLARVEAGGGKGSSELVAGIQACITMWSNR